LRSSIAIKEETNMRIIFIALAIAVLELQAQVPESTARITRTIPDEGGTAIEFENTGLKPINAVAIENVVPGEPISPMWSDFPGQPLEHNGRGTQRSWKKDVPTAQLHIIAVIFEDGTAIGYSKPYDDQPDIVTSIFLRRKGAADAWVRWKNFVKSLADQDAKTAVTEFIKAANAIPVVHTFHGQAGDDEAMGENNVLGDVQTQAANAQGILSSHDHDAAWVREEILNKYINGRAQECAKFAQRRIGQ
jgi:hypothetical protein